MIVVIGVLIGAVYGAWLAKRRGGNRADMAQYGAGFAIAFGLLGLAISIALSF